MVNNFNIVDGTNATIYSTDQTDLFRISGTVAITVNWAVVYSGTPSNAEVRTIHYSGKVTLAGNHIVVLGITMPDIYASKEVLIHCYYNGATWDVSFKPDFSESDVIQESHLIDLAVTTAKINNLAVTTAKINLLAVTDAQLAANAVTTTKILNNAVTLAKLAQIAPNTVLINDGVVDAIPQAYVMNASTWLGRTAGSQLQACTAAEMITELQIRTEPLADGRIWVGNVGGHSTAVIMSGDATIINTGAVTIADSRITEQKLGSETAGTISKGAVACQIITAAGFKAKLTGADVNLFPVKAGDIILDVIIHVSVAGTTAAKTFDIGYDANVGLVTPGVADDNGIITAAPTDASANYSCLNVTYDGAAIVAGSLTVAADGYITVGITDNTDLHLDATLVAYCIMYYLPA
jgi:hypothetical protein